MPELFTATISAKSLKEAVDCAKSISDTMHLDLDAGQEPAIRFWAIDANRLFAVEGRLDSAEDVEGSEGATIQVPSKLLAGCVAMIKTTAKDRITVTLEDLDDEYSLSFRQIRPGQEPSIRTITVEASDTLPLEKQIPTGAYASVDLTQFSKVLNSFTGNTDTVTLAVTRDMFRASLSTKHLEDDWQHPSTTKGQGQGLFAVRSLKNVITAASKVDRAGEVFVVEGHPLIVEVSSEHLRAKYLVADREAMR